VVYHYLREHISTDVYRTIGIDNDWPYNCDIHYNQAVEEIWCGLSNVYSGQSTAEKLLEAWNGLRQEASENVQEYINRVYCAQEELSLAGAMRSEAELKAKLRCGLRDQRLQGDMLQHNGLPLHEFVAMMSQKVIDFDRQAGQNLTAYTNPANLPSQLQLNWANGVPQRADSVVTANQQSAQALSTPPLAVVELDETFLNGVQPGPLPDGSFGCARGCKDPSCKGVRTCQLQKPNLPSGVCSYCARAHGGSRETDCPAYRKVCARCSQAGHFAAACRSAPSKTGKRHARGKGKGKPNPKPGNVTAQNDAAKPSQDSSVMVTLDGAPTTGCSSAEIYSILASANLTKKGEREASDRLRGAKVQATVSVQLLTRDESGGLRASDKCNLVALWDSGASGNFVRYDIIEQILGRPPKGGVGCSAATLADGSRIQSLGICRLSVQSPRCTATVMAFVVKDLTAPLVIGTPGLAALGVRIDFGNDGNVSISTGLNLGRGVLPKSSPPDELLPPSSPTTMPRPSSASPSCSPVALVDDGVTVLASADLPPGLHHRRHTKAGKAPFQCPELNYIEPSDSVPYGVNEPLGRSQPLSGQSLLPAHQCIHVDTLRDGRFAVSFNVSVPDLQRSAGRGWRAAVARASKASLRLSTEGKRQADEAISKLLESGYVGYMTLRDTSRPPPPHVVNNLYRNNPLVKDSYLVSDTYLSGHLPAFIGAQFVFKDSSSTPCRIVYDCRPTNGLLQTPTMTRWCLHDYLLQCCTHPTAVFMDIRQAYNQLAMTPTSSAVCGTVLQRPSTKSNPSPKPMLILWVSVAFGMAPSGGALELATAHVCLEAEQLLSMLCPPSISTPAAIPPLPVVYETDTYQYARPILAAAYKEDLSQKEWRVLRKLSSTLSWRDYVDDWVVLGHHYIQTSRCRDVMLSCGNHHLFTFPPSKTHESWDLGEDPVATVLGYELTADDCLRPIISVELLPEDGTATKRMASSALAGLYDPLGRYLEMNMNSRLIWRKVVQSINDSYPSASPTQSWTLKPSVAVIAEINQWIARLRALPPVPRFIPVRPGPMLEGASDRLHHCEIIVSCDASNQAWSVDTRSRLDHLPISPRLRARGGLFPRSQSKSDPSLTTPRRELHALLQASKEVLSLCRACKLDQTMQCSVTVMTDSLINLQRLQWAGTKSHAELEQELKKSRRRTMTVLDLSKVLAIRENLLRTSAAVDSLRVMHIPSALNIADPASRCMPDPISPGNLRILENILDNPNPDLRPVHVPRPLLEPEDEEPQDSGGKVDLCISTPAPVAGPLPTPLTDDDHLPILTAEEISDGSFEASIQDSVKQDTLHNAIFHYLANHKTTPGISIKRLRALSNQYK
ncbi:hypothetical protein FOZ62_025720, partial [Perkinsus olseni]